MYYKLIADQDVFELNPGLRAVAGFKDLTDMQMKYICLMCDPSHDNPIRTLQGKAKREKAVLLAGYRLETDGKRIARNGRDIVDGRVKSIEEGIQIFKSLHYDEKVDTYEALAVQIGEIRDFLKAKKDNDPRKLRQAISLGVELPGLVEAKLKIEQLLNVTTSFKPQLESAFTIDIATTEEIEESSEPQSILDQYMKTKQ